MLLWKNEKKIVTFQKCMDRAEKEVVGSDSQNISGDNNYKLVHVTGKTENKADLVDRDFDITVENSYRLTRTVEVYQWQEIKEQEEERVTYKYVQGWYSHPIDSSKFDDQSKRNPGNWPFQSSTSEAQNVTLGDYKLNASQISRLGRSRTNKIEPTDDQVDQTRDQMESTGFSSFEVRGHYLVASAEDNSIVGEHIGQMRVSFSHDQCGVTTIIAQQMQDDDEVFTFRKWNPDKIDVPLSESTDAEGDQAYGSPLCCYICMCVNCLFNVMFEEVVDHTADQQVSTGSYFDGQKDAVKSAGSCFRPLGIFLEILGFYLLFTPVIKLLKWIPLVGWLLGGFASIAAALFAIVVGLTLSILVIAIAWLFFRPLIGIPLLLVVGTSIYLTFYYDWGTEGAETDASGTFTPAPSTGGTTGGTTVKALDAALE